MQPPQKPQRPTHLGQDLRAYSASPYQPQLPSNSLSRSDQGPRLGPASAHGLGLGSGLGSLSQQQQRQPHPLDAISNPSLPLYSSKPHTAAPPSSSRLEATISNPSFNFLTPQGRPQSNQYQTSSGNFPSTAPHQRLRPTSMSIDPQEAAFIQQFGGLEVPNGKSLKRNSSVTLPKVGVMPAPPVIPQPKPTANVHSPTRQAIYAVLAAPPNPRSPKSVRRLTLPNPLPQNTVLTEENTRDLPHIPQGPPTQPMPPRSTSAPPHLLPQQQAEALRRAAIEKVEAVCRSLRIKDNGDKLLPQKVESLSHFEDLFESWKASLWFAPTGLCEMAALEPQTLEKAYVPYYRFRMPPKSFLKVAYTARVGFLVEGEASTEIVWKDVSEVASHPVESLPALHLNPICGLPESEEKKLLLDEVAHWSFLHECNELIELPENWITSQEGDGLGEGQEQEGSKKKVLDAKLYPGQALAVALQKHIFPNQIASLEASLMNKYKTPHVSNVTVQQVFLLSTDNLNNKDVPPPSPYHPSKDQQMEIVNHTEIEYDLLYVPVFYGLYQFNGVDYTFLVNATVGQGTGERPKGLGRVGLVFNSLLESLGLREELDLAGLPSTFAHQDSPHPSRQNVLLEGQDLQKLDKCFIKGYYRHDRAYLLFPSSVSLVAYYGVGVIKLANSGDRPLGLFPKRRIIYGGTPLSRICRCLESGDELGRSHCGGCRGSPYVLMPNQQVSFKYKGLWAIEITEGDPLALTVLEIDPGVCLAPTSSAPGTDEAREKLEAALWTGEDWWKKTATYEAVHSVTVPMYQAVVPRIVHVMAPLIPVLETQARRAWEKLFEVAEMINYRLPTTPYKKKIEHGDENPSSGNTKVAPASVVLNNPYQQ